MCMWLTIHWYDLVCWQSKKHNTEATMSAAVFPVVKKEDKYEDVDFETLLEQLSPEEIEELSLELIDPDVSWHCRQE